MQGSFVSMIQVYWKDNAETLLIMEFNGTWNGNQYLNAVNEAKRLVHHKSHYVFTIVDFREYFAFKGMVGVWVRLGMNHHPDNAKLVVVVTRNPFLHRIYPALISRTDQERVKIVTTMEEAYTLIRNAGGRLPDDEDAPRSG